ncbi:hypothetical protein ABIB82_002069 [Bradyrhizobium sp. i1.8.4]
MFWPHNFLWVAIRSYHSERECLLEQSALQRVGLSPPARQVAPRLLEENPSGTGWRPPVGAVCFEQEGNLRVIELSQP